jgi:hypothetical protein
MRQVIQRCLVVTAILASMCGSVSAEQAGKGWYGALRLGYQPYAVDIDGTLLGREFSASASLSDIMDKTDTTILGGEVEFGKDKWFITLGAFYQKSEADKGDTTLGATVTLKELGVNPMFGYRVYQQRLGGGYPFAVDLTAGVFYVKVDTDVTIYSPLGNVSRSRDIDFLDPMIGARASLGLTQKFGVGASGEIGGFGVGSELQYVAAANLIYNFTDWFAVSGGYKYWYFRYEDDNAPLSKLVQKIYGPLVGVQLKF